MDEENLEKIKLLLLKMKSGLQEQEKTSKETRKLVELDQTKVGRISRMDAMQTQQMALDGLRRRQLQLVKNESAFKRIESGDYDYCLGCDAEIDIRRLMVDPTNMHCIKNVESHNSVYSVLLTG